MTKDEFRSLAKLDKRTVTFAGKQIVVRTLSLNQKRAIREDNMIFSIEDGKPKQSINTEKFMVDTIIASCVEPSFGDSDVDWMMNDSNGDFINELYTKIDSTVKLSDLDAKKLSS